MREYSYSECRRKLHNESSTSEKEIDDNQRGQEDSKVMAARCDIHIHNSRVRGAG